MYTYTRGTGTVQLLVLYQKLGEIRIRSEAVYSAERKEVQEEVGGVVVFQRSQEWG